MSAESRQSVSPLTPRRAAAMLGLAWICAAVGPVGAEVVWQDEGPFNETTPGWSFTPSRRKGQLSYIPDEGYYLDKGGSLCGPKIPSPDGALRFYRYTFAVKSPVRCYWALDFFDSDGERIQGDDYGLIEPDSELQRIETVFYGRWDMQTIMPFFRSHEPLTVQEGRIERISAAEAAEWCDRVYAALPPLRYEPPAGRADGLPRTFAALREGKRCRILMLGHSLYNDAFNSNFAALLMRQYPQADVEVIWSGRGGTGCEHYQDHFEEYIGRYDPDLLILCTTDKHPDGSSVKHVIEQTRRQLAACEILMMTEPFGVDPREHAEDDWATPLPPQTLEPEPERRASIATMRELARRETLPLLDAHTVWLEYLGASGKPWQWFHRDRVHANDRGKQVCGRILEAYFRDPASIVP